MEFHNGYYMNQEDLDNYLTVPLPCKNTIYFKKKKEVYLQYLVKSAQQFSILPEL